MNLRQNFAGICSGSRSLTKECEGALAFKENWMDKILINGLKKRMLFNQVIIYSVFKIFLKCFEIIF